MEEDNLRCFIALDIPREAITYLEGIQELIQKKNLLIGKFTEPENLHLTLKFLGHIDESTVEKVKEKLKEIRFPSFEAELGGLGVFSKNFIKIVWVRLENCGKLQKEVDEKLNGLFEREDRFMSHITIARVKKVKDKQGLLDYIKNVKTKKTRFKVSKFFLKKSILSSDGPVYEDLESYSLAESGKRK